MLSLKNQVMFTSIVEAKQWYANRFKEETERGEIFLVWKSQFAFREVSFGEPLISPPPPHLFNYNMEKWLLSVKTEKKGFACNSEQM